MRKIYVLVLISGFAYGQEITPRVFSGKAKYELTAQGRIGIQSGSGCGDDITGGLQWIAIQYEKDNRFETLIKGGAFYPNNGKGMVDADLGPVTRDFYDDDKIINLIIRTTRRGSFVTCHDVDYTEATIPLPTQYNEFIMFENYNLNQPGSLTTIVNPLINLKNSDPIDDMLGTDSPLIIPPITGILPQHFQWQYHIVGDDTESTIWGPDPNCIMGNEHPEYCPEVPTTIITHNWHLLPAGYLGKNYLNIAKGSDVFPAEALGKQITLKGNSYTENGLNFTYTISAPHIVSVVRTPTSCPKSEDGKATITFDRALLPGEILNLDLENDVNNVILDSNNSYTIEGLYQGLKTLNLLGSYITPEGIPLTPYAMEPSHHAEFEITSPTPVDFSLSKIDIRCKDGWDGEIKITAEGGMEGGIYQFAIKTPYTEYGGGEYSDWKSFADGTKHIVKDLSRGDYFIKVRKIKDANDATGCMAQWPSDEDKILTKTISEPDSIVSLKYTQVLQPTHYGGTNGKIVAKITGGTPDANHFYSYEWKNNTRIVQTSITTVGEYHVDSYYITLDGIPSDTYYLTVRDKNYDSATQNGGCTVENDTLFVGEPDPIQVTFEQEKAISCHASNEFGDETDFNPADGQRDESQDGILKATVTGGVRFLPNENNGLPYHYYWKKQQADGSWIAWGDTDEIAQHLSDEKAQHLSEGTYALNVKDKNGIQLGTYVNNVLTQQIDSTYSIAQPKKLELSFEKQDVSCNISTNGWARAVVSGGTPDVSSGTPDYSYEWANGATTSTISGLTANSYFVRITDTKKCQVQGAVLVNQPNEVQFNETLTPPDCHQGDNGAITLSLTGGTEPYSFVWNTAEITPNLFHLKADTYSVTATDGQGCSYFKSFTLADPPPITIDLGSDRTLCNGQSLDFDASIVDPNAQYQWTGTNGFTSDEAKVNLTQEGMYTAKVTSSKGCEGQDTITVQTNNVAIDAEFFLSSQAYLDEEVILVNNSNPLGETTHWVIPERVTIVEQKDDFIVLKFATIGAYTISLQQTQGDCYALYSKNINVEQRSTLSDNNGRNSASITDFIVTPNPSDGNFTVVVNLKNSSPVSLRIFAYNGQSPVLRRTASGEKNYKIDFKEQLAAGIYVLVLETAQQTIVKKIIIN